MAKVGRTDANVSRPPKRAKGDTGEPSLLGDVLDERERVPLDEFRRRFVQEGNGLRYALFHYLVAERYRALRENSYRRFIEGREHAHWPVPPQDLSTSYMVMPTKEDANRVMDGAGEGLRATALDDRPAVPLACLVHPRRRKGSSMHAFTEDTINVVRHGLLEEGVVRETRAPPHPGVTMDQSYSLHVALTEATEKLWPACMERWREVYGGGEDSLSSQGVAQESGESAFSDQQQKSSLVLVTPALDPFLKRAVAEQVQPVLSSTFDWCLDLLQWPVERASKGLQYSMDARNVLRAAERASVPPWVLDRVRGRIRRLFPSMPSIEE